MDTNNHSNRNSYEKKINFEKFNWEEIKSKLDGRIVFIGRRGCVKVLVKN